LSRAVKADEISVVEPIIERLGLLSQPLDEPSYRMV